MWNDILARAGVIAQKFARDGSVAWFRGHPVGAWHLESALHRHVKDLTAPISPPIPEVDRLMLLRQEAKSIYYQFKAEAWPLLEASERSDWGVVFTMQHYGIPTRLLDWSESFACALFFAMLRRDPEIPAAIWVLDPQGLNKVSVGVNDLVALTENMEQALIDLRDWHPQWKAETSAATAVAVAPIFTNPRMTAQRAAFTLMRDSFIPLEAQFDGRLLSEERLVKLDIPPACFDDAIEYLELSGTSAFTVYPDLEGLAFKHKMRTQTRRENAAKWFPNRYRPGCRPLR